MVKTDRSHFETLSFAVDYNASEM